MADNISQEEEKRIKEMIDNLVKRAKKASKEYLKLDQETVNKVIVLNMKKQLVLLMKMMKKII